MGGVIRASRPLRYYRSVTRLFSVLALACIVLLSACNAGRPPRIGETAPDFTLTDSQRTVTLSQMRGKPVLLNFWATWCAPCIEGVPFPGRLQQKTGGKQNGL